MIPDESCLIVLDAEGAIRSQQYYYCVLDPLPGTLGSHNLLHDLLFFPCLAENPTHHSQSGRLDHRVVDPQATQTWSLNMIYDRIEVMDEVLNLTCEKHSRFKRYRSASDALNSGLWTLKCRKCDRCHPNN